MPERAEVAVARLLSLVGWIAQHPGAPVDHAAGHFGRSRDQLLRDIALVGAVHDSMPGDSFEIDWDLLEREDRLAVRPVAGVGLPPRLTPSEAMAVLIGLQAIAPALDDDLRARLPRTAMAVAALSPGADGMGEEILVSGAPGHDGRVDLLNRALRDGRRVGFDYTTADGRSARREVDPWDLRRGADGWVLRGWCHRAQGERSFRLAQMADLRVLDRPLARPRPPAGCDGDGDAGLPTVRLTLTDAARWVAEEVPGRLVEDEGGRFTLEIRVWDRDWVEALLIDVAAHLVSVDPPAFARSMAERARAALDVWEGDR